MKNLLRTTILSASVASVLFAGGMSDDPLNYKVTLEALEIVHSDEQVFSWDTNVWLGYDLNKIYIYSEGEKIKDIDAQSETQIVWSNAIAPYWDIQYGLGHDKTPENSKTWGVISLMGMAPYFFETRTTLLIGEDGNIGLRASAEYEALITQRLHLSPSIGASAYSKDDESMEIQKGIANISLGINLKYEIIREFAPYIGIAYEADVANSKSETNLVTGVSIWF